MKRQGRCSSLVELASRCLACFEPQDEVVRAIALIPGLPPALASKLLTAAIASRQLRPRLLAQCLLDEGVGVSHPPPSARA